MTCPGRFELTPTQVFDVDIFSSPSLEQPSYKKVLALYSQDKPCKLVFNVGKEETNWYMGGGKLSRAVYLVPPTPTPTPTQVFDVDLFSSPSLEQP